MKARDIIPGWPRPRTTASVDKWFWVPKWRLYSDEECENIRYHQQQAAMARKFIEQGKPLGIDAMLFVIRDFEKNVGPVR